MPHFHRTGWRRIWWFPPLPVGARIFEIGYGPGDYRRAAEARGWIWSGCEPADGTGTAEDAPWPVATYDAVVGWQSLEHLDDPAFVLRRVRRALKPGGYLAVSVPNRRSLERWWMGAEWDGWKPGTHNSHWTPRTLGDLLYASGFRVEAVLHQRIVKHFPGGFAMGALIAALHLSPRMTVIARPT